MKPRNDGKRHKVLITVKSEYVELESRMFELVTNVLHQRSPCLLFLHLSAQFESRCCRLWSNEWERERFFDPNPEMTKLVLGTE